MGWLFLGIEAPRIDVDRKADPEVLPGSAEILAPFWGWFYFLVLACPLLPA